MDTPKLKFSPVIAGYTAVIVGAGVLVYLFYKDLFGINGQVSKAWNNLWNGLDQNALEKAQTAAIALAQPTLNYDQARSKWLKEWEAANNSGVSQALFATSQPGFPSVQDYAKGVPFPDPNTFAPL